MVSRQIITPGGQDDVQPHEHDATEVTGVFNFLRALNALIDGDLTLKGFFRTGKETQRIEIRPSGTEGGAVPSIAFLTGAEFATSEPFIEIEDQGGGVWALKLFGPVGNAATDDAAILLRSDGRVDINAASRVAFGVGGSEVARIAADGLARGAEPAYLFKETVYITANGSFAKADYPGLRAVRVRMVGGGGGGSGIEAAASSTTCSIGGAGWGAGYAESFILAADLDTSEAVTVGAGGGGGAAGNNNGTTGGDSIFDSISGEVRAKGGHGGTTRIAAGSGAQMQLSQDTPPSGTGDLVIPGTQPGILIRLTGNSGSNGPGGSSFFGQGGRGRSQTDIGDGFSASTGGFGGGGGGGYDRNTGGNTARAGGPGRDGIVVVDVYV